jgi:hypothetical protein
VGQRQAVSFERFALDGVTLRPRLRVGLVSGGYF